MAPWIMFKIIVLAHFMTRYRVSAERQDGFECQTVSGPIPNASCVFPFTVEDRIYDSCTCDHARPGDSAWCSTMVDESGNHVQGQWGTCNASCSFDSDCQLKSKPDSNCKARTRMGNGKVMPCLFPFRLRGKWYFQCTYDFSEDGEAWCATAVNVHGDVAMDAHGICEKKCLENLEQWLPGMQINGAESFERMLLPSPEECESLCLDTHICDQWMWSSESQECQLQFSGGCSQTYEDNGEFISGLIRKTQCSEFPMVPVAAAAGGSVPEVPSTVPLSFGVKRPGSYCCKPCWRKTALGWRAYKFGSKECLTI